MWPGWAASSVSASKVKGALCPSLLCPRSQRVGGGLSEGLLPLTASPEPRVPEAEAPFADAGAEDGRRALWGYNWTPHAGHACLCLLPQPQPSFPLAMSCPSPRPPTPRGEREEEGQPRWVGSKSCSCSATPRWSCWHWGGGGGELRGLAGAWARVRSAVRGAQACVEPRPLPPSLGESASPLAPQHPPAAAHTGGRSLRGEHIWQRERPRFLGTRRVCVGAGRCRQDGPHSSSDAGAGREAGQTTQARRANGSHTCSVPPGPMADGSIAQRRRVLGAHRCPGTPPPTTPPTPPHPSHRQHLPFNELAAVKSAATPAGAGRPSPSLSPVVLCSSSPRTLPIGCWGAGRERETQRHLHVGETHRLVASCTSPDPARAREEPATD